MADDDPRDEDIDDVEEVEEVDEDDKAKSEPKVDPTFAGNRFGIDLGRRGDKAEQTSRDEVEPPPVERVKNPVRTLSDRLASAAADRLDGTVDSESDED